MIEEMDGEEAAGEEGEEGEEGEGAWCTRVPPRPGRGSHGPPRAAGNQVIGIDEPDNADDVGQAVPISERITTPYMTKYERARVLGTRALQIR